MGRPKKSEGRDTRAEILDAALNLFAISGYFGTSMRQIARAVGVRESALYHHFPSKESILNELMGELGPARAQQLAAVDVPMMARQLGVEGLLRAVVDRLTEEWFNPREQKFLRLLMSEAPRLSEAGLFDARAFTNAGRMQVARLFSELVRVKAIRKIDPAGAAIAFIGPMVALRMIHLGLPGGTPDLKAMKKDITLHLDYFIDGIT